MILKNGKLVTTIRHILCIILFIVLTTSGFSQASTPASDAISNKPDVESWNLNGFLWGYARENARKGHKPLIDFNTIDNWKVLGEYLSVSPNGKYFAYGIDKPGDELISDNSLDTLIVQSTVRSWRCMILNSKPGFFSGNSKFYVYKDKERLCFLELATGKKKMIDRVGSSKIPLDERNDWLAYQLNDRQGTVVLHDLIKNKKTIFDSTTAYDFDVSRQWLIYKGIKESDLSLYHLGSGKHRHFCNVLNYAIDRSGSNLVVQMSATGDMTVLKYVSLLSGSERTIWRSSDSSVHITNFCLDQIGSQVAFILTSLYSDERRTEQKTNSIWYYRLGMEKAVSMVTNQTAGIERRMRIQETLDFSDNGHYIQFCLLPPNLSKPKSHGAQLDVWSYKDTNLQSSQALNRNTPESFFALINVLDSTVRVLDKVSNSWINGDYAFIRKRGKDRYGDRFWEPGYCRGLKVDSVWIFSLKNNTRWLLPNKGTLNLLSVSPSGKYLIYFDTENGCHYFSYDLHSGKTTKISGNIAGWQLATSPHKVRTNDKPILPYGLAGWLQDDKGILVYDKCDIWQLDLAGKIPPINVTKGFGGLNGIVFSSMDNRRFDNYPSVQFKEKNNSILLMGFNTRSKQTGIYRATTGIASSPRLLSVGSDFFYFNAGVQDFDVSAQAMRPVKARDANVWIVQRQSDKEAPNYFKTRNFRSFDRLTDFHPQKQYEWLFQELHSFRHLDGETGQGILYKPENFDPARKYPVLIVFYGVYSDNMYQFPVPGYNSTAITGGTSPIWFLNNGYLVFTPDIYVRPLKYGPTAFNIIEGVAKYLKTLSYVDSSSLGVCSHSWSAKLGAYIFTHSKSFAATAISEGFLYANMLNVALSTNTRGLSKLEEVENNFYFGNLWEHKNLWLDQTTVLNVDKSDSPLLLFCNKESSEEYQNQTLQFFTALRRLEKPVWWLKYDKGAHVLWDGDELKDYTIRFTQFFDHYLKRAPAPKWMTQGIPYALRAAVSKYELDPTGTCSLPNKKDCKICKQWNKQYEKHPEMFKKPAGEWHLE